MKTERSHKRILFIDEELSWLSFARNTLERLGYIVWTSQSTKDGWKLLQNEEFDLILVDLRKVDIDPDIFGRIATLQAKRNHFVAVMFPTELTPQKVGEILKLGAHDCVDKEYEESKLIALVESRFSKKAGITPPIKRRPDREQPVVLIIDDDEDWRTRLADYLKDQPYRIEVTGEQATALQLLQEQHFDVIVLDLRLLDNGDEFEGMNLLNHIRKQGQTIPVIIVSAYGTVDHVREGFNVHNIFDYISKQSFERIYYQNAVQRAIYQYS